MQSRVQIKEIFESIQGEGPCVGVNQLFIRFSKCNLNCNYCDTEFRNDLKEFSVDELLSEVNKHQNIHSISLTGGEPLCDTDFLYEFLQKTDKKIYLETNGTLYEQLSLIIDKVDIISMDIKLPSISNGNDYFYAHEEFIKIAKNAKELFAKVVFDENITDDEIIKTAELAQKYGVILVLQPKMNGNYLATSTEFINETYYKFISVYDYVRLIPQVHKFLNVR